MKIEMIGKGGRVVVRPEEIDQYIRKGYVKVETSEKTIAKPRKKKASATAVADSDK